MPGHQPRKGDLRSKGSKELNLFILIVCVRDSVRPRQSTSCKCQCVRALLLFLYSTNTNKRQNHKPKIVTEASRQKQHEDIQ